MVRYPISSETVLLTAGSEQAPVQRVRIYVNGRLSASVENEDSRALAMLCAAAIIPPPEDGPADLPGGCST
jgi:hypothetical protein